MDGIDPLTARTSCRACGADELTFIFSLGNQYVSNFVDTDEGMRAPLDLVLCDVSTGGCGLLQLRHTVPRELLYKRYWYRSGINKTMRDALAAIADKAQKVVSLSPGDIVLDIGCNDGTLLRSFTSPGLRLVGFEPAANLISEAEVGTTRIFNEFFSSQSFHKEFGGAHAKLVTSIAMFYDLEDPNEFAADIVKCLDADGVWIIQMSYLPFMLEQTAFDNICHEHLEYYSLRSLRHLVERHGLEICDVELNDVNGGSFQVYLRRGGHRALSDSGRERVEALERYEKNLGLHERKIYEEFAHRVLRLRTQLCGVVRDETEKGKTVYVYGASTKGNTLLQFCDLDYTLIQAAADRNPDKWGKKTVGTLIPIISEEQARAEKPDYFLVLPWSFIQEFKGREREFLEAGGRFIVPLPNFAIISARDADSGRE